MITLLRTVRVANEMVVIDGVGIPLVGLAAEEAVVAVKPSLQRPIRAVRPRGDLLLRDVVVLAKPEGAIASSMPWNWRNRKLLIGCHKPDESDKPS
jgi:hypothetical protein